MTILFIIIIIECAAILSAEKHSKEKHNKELWDAYSKGVEGDLTGFMNKYNQK